MRQNTEQASVHRTSSADVVTSSCGLYAAFEFADERQVSSARLGLMSAKAQSAAFSYSNAWHIRLMLLVVGSRTLQLADHQLQTTIARETCRKAKPLLDRPVKTRYLTVRMVQAAIPAGVAFLARLAGALTGEPSSSSSMRLVR